jgi:proteasome lid subunit RPN8/RPN11
MYRYIAFLDDVLSQIEEKVAAFPPERGGALLGPVGQPLVTEFIYDQVASTSGVTFRPSRWLEGQVHARERGNADIEFKGILHSHPGGMSWPSSGDHIAYEDSLGGAPWLGRLVTPIVTVGRRPCEEHELALPSGIMSVYVTERRSEGVVVERAAPHVLPFSQHLQDLAAALKGTASCPGSVEIEGQLYLSGVIQLPALDLQVLAGPAYPFTAPTVIAAPRPAADGVCPDEPRLGLHWDGTNLAPQAIPLGWDLEISDDDRLVVSLFQAGEAEDLAAEETSDAAVGDEVSGDLDVSEAAVDERAAADEAAGAAADEQFGEAGSGPEAAGASSDGHDMPDSRGTSGVPDGHDARGRRVLRAVGRVLGSPFTLLRRAFGSTSSAEAPDAMPDDVPAEMTSPVPAELVPEGSHDESAD